MSGEVTVKVDVLKNRKDIPTPFIVTQSHYITTAADPSLDNCSVAAAKKMHRFLQEHSVLTDAQSGMLLSLVGNLRISQVVNPSKGCIMEFPIGLAKEKFEK
jgi:amidase